MNLHSLINSMNGFIALVIDKTGETAETVTETVTETAAGTSGSWIDFIPTILIWGGMIALMYFLLIRPQRKRDKQQSEMQQAIKVGDKVLTSSGFYGKVVDVGTDAFMIEFGDNRGIRVPVRKTDVLGIKTPDMSPPNKDPMTLEDKDKKDEKKDNM